MRGCKIQFLDNPVQKCHRPTVLNKYEADILNSAFKNCSLLVLLHKQYMNQKNIFLPFLFAPKKDGSYRMILNLKQLNQSIEYMYIHFKMGCLQSATRMMTPDCYMASIDLKDAYYTVNVNKHFRKYLRFIWKGQLFEYTCLPNGLACAPRLFTKLMKPVFGQLVTLTRISVSYIH